MGDAGAPFVVPRGLAAVPGRKPIPLALESLLQLPIQSPTSPPWKQDTEATSGLAGPAPTRSKRVVVVPLLILLVLWLWLFCSGGAFSSGPNGQTLGIDYAMFYAAARVMDAGGNPYDRDLLYRAERSVLDKQHLPITERPIVRVGNPPLLFWALRPLSRLPFQPLGWIWIVTMYGSAAIGMVALLRHGGWSTRVLPLLIFLAMPQVVSASYTGNLNALVFLGLVGALLLQTHRPFLAGVLLSLAWIKPQVAFPAVLLIWMFLTPFRQRLGLGFIAATSIGVALTLISTGASSMGQWLHGLMGYSQDMAVQPQVASLAGAYVRWAPGPLRLALAVGFLALAVLITAWWWWRTRKRRSDAASVAWLWFVWLLATPYAHFHDEMVLVIPLVALLGRDGQALTRPTSVIALYTLFLSWLLFVWTPFRVQLLWLPLLLAGGCAALALRAPLRDGAGAAYAMEVI